MNLICRQNKFNKRKTFTVAHIFQIKNDLKLYKVHVLQLLYFNLKENYFISLDGRD